MCACSLCPSQLQNTVSANATKARNTGKAIAVAFGEGVSTNNRRVRDFGFWCKPAAQPGGPPFVDSFQLLPL